MGSRVNPHLFAVLALVRSFPVVLRHGVFHNVLLAQHCEAAYLAMVLANRQRELQVVKDRAMHAVVQRMREPYIATTAICKWHSTGLKCAWPTRRAK